MTPGPLHRGVLRLLASVAAGGCAELAPGEPGPVLEIAVSPTPATLGAARILLTLSDTMGVALGDATVVVSGRSPTGVLRAADTARPRAAGRYVIESFPFDTTGVWSLEAAARLADGEVVRAEHPIRVVGPPTGR